MTRYRFDDFVLDPDDRRLSRADAAVEVSARYLDALTLLVGDAGQLVTKDRFMAEVWRGVPVTDEALTQCVRALRRALGDDAARPRFIETVPKHGYRFVGAVERVEGAAVERPADPPVAAVAARGTGGIAADAVFGEAGTPGRTWLRLTLAGTLGAGVAGVVGGLFYGSVAAASPDAGIGGASVLLVVLWLTIAVALTGGAGVSAGIAAARAIVGGAGGAWQVAGGAVGGFVVGGVAKLLGLDAFHLLLGRAPAGITGAVEGLALGGAVGVAAWLGGERSPQRQATIAVLVGATAGAGVIAAGGRLMGGSLTLLAHTFAESRLHLAIEGPAGIAAGALEGGLFAGALVGATALAQAASASAISRREPSTP